MYVCNQFIIQKVVSLTGELYWTSELYIQTFIPTIWLIRMFPLLLLSLNWTGPCKIYKGWNFWMQITVTPSNAVWFRARINLLSHFSFLKVLLNKMVHLYSIHSLVLEIWHCLIIIFTVLFNSLNGLGNGPDPIISVAMKPDNDSVWCQIGE